MIDGSRTGTRWDARSKLTAGQGCLPQNSTYAPANAALRCTAEMDRWVGDLSDYIKDIDPNHLVTVGSEGFYSTLSGPGERF